MRVRYSSNNSGGSWWLADDQWKALEAAGWEVEWYKKGALMSRPDKDGKYRFLGALASYAYLECESIEEAVESFERITGEDASASGCDCCGQPHYFSQE